jgi:hypothetical protein
MQGAAPVGSGVRCRACDGGGEGDAPGGGARVQEMQGAAALHERRRRKGRGEERRVTWE